MERIVIFGASGRTGRSVVAQAVQRGDEVVVLVRDASKQWFPDAVMVRQGHPVGSARRRGGARGRRCRGLGARPDRRGDDDRDLGRDAGDRRRDGALGSAPDRDRREREGPGRQRGHRGVRERRRGAPPGRGHPAGEPAGLDRRRGADARPTTRRPVPWSPSSTARRPAARSRAATSPACSSTRLGTDAWIGHVVGVSNPPAVR